jgi:hypothetical protein
MTKPDKQSFIELFPNDKPFTGAAVYDPDDAECSGISEWLVGKSWTDISYDDLCMLGTSLDCFSREAIAYFFPAYVLAAMDDLNNEELDYTVLNYIAGDDRILLKLGYNSRQLRVMLDAIEYIRYYSKEKFNGLDASIHSHARACLHSV